MNYSPAFYQALDNEPGVTLLLDPEGVIRYVNPAWGRAAASEGFASACTPESVLGRRYLDFVLGELKPRVARALERAAALPTMPHSVWLRGECNTGESLKSLVTRISALFDPEAGLVGYLVHSDQEVIGPLSSKYESVEFEVAQWRDGDGVLLQCGCCRRVRHPQTGQWAMNPALLKQDIDNVSHGLCELCLETYYREI